MAVPLTEYIADMLRGVELTPEQANRLRLAVDLSDRSVQPQPLSVQVANALDPEAIAAAAERYLAADSPFARPRAEEEYEIDPPLTTAQAVQVQSIINTAIIRDRADREKDEPHPEPSNDAPEVEVGKIAAGEDEHGIYAGGWCAPNEEIYQHLAKVGDDVQHIVASRGGGMTWGAQVTATDQPVVIDSLAELRELDSIDLRLWFHSTRKLLTVLGYPRERLNQIVTEAIFAEED